MFPEDQSQFVEFAEGGEAVGSTMFVSSTTEEYGATFTIAEGDRRVEFLDARDHSKGVFLRAAIDRTENALTLFDPPLLVARLEAVFSGEPLISETSMRVVALDDPSKTREKGKARRTVTYVGDAIVQTLHGQTRAHEFEILFEADLRFANAVERTTCYCVLRTKFNPSEPMAGILAMMSEEKVTILGAFPRTTRRMLVRER